MPHALLAALAALSIVAAVSPAETWDLKAETVAAFDRYVRLTEARMDAEIAGTSAFLWLDRQPASTRADIAAKLGRGEVVVAKLDTRDNGREIDAPDGLLHHWIGTVFLSGVKIDRALAFVQDYGKYPTIFAPVITRSRVVSRTGNTFAVQMRTTTHKVITVTIDADYAIEYRNVSPARTFTKSVAHDLYEVSSAGTASESRTPADRGAGYLWRLNTYCSFEERAEGVYEQCESISLTRGIPYLLGPIVRPFVSGIPRETLEHTLGRVRAGLAK